MTQQQRGEGEPANPISQPVDTREQRPESVLGSAYNLTDYRIQALDGEIGKLDEATYDLGSDHIVVDTGPWIFGRKRLLPADAVTAIDHEEQRILVDRTKQQVENAPELDEARLTDPGYRESLARPFAEARPAWASESKVAP